ncbi:hypothetical protein [Paenibacillus aceris]|uniref:Uncharacterized protein n=1 Tax=Paenibacillus aceris TaxID=869555 RepID=A0ABS4HXE8_9BACL|nr:hypothetical protein [Paenibacillus aceris]MBP1963303.1 hypothetical protein [Paenibacillus aceris]NHW36191.1 hypothetical protein [Paenibacillus aceris]
MPITIADNFTMNETEEIGLSFEYLQQYKITRIECFRFDSDFAKKLQLGHERDDICGLIAISTNTGAVGLKEFAVPSKSLKCDLTMWAVLFQRIKGLTLKESMNYAQLKQEAWGPVRFELIESALMDLIEKIKIESKNNKEHRYFWDRAYLFEHAQAYISF